MKTVYSTHEIPHLWAHGTTQDARCSANLSIRGTGIYSYATCMARRLEHKGRTFYVVNSTSYSVSTSRHQSAIRAAIPLGATVFYVSHESRGSNLFEYRDFKELGKTLYADAMDCASRAASAVLDARRASTAEKFKASQASHLLRANAISEFFKLRRRANAEEIERLARCVKRAEEKKETEEKARALRQIEKDKEDIVAWQQGAPQIHLSHYLPCYLRTENHGLVDINGNDGREIVTSKGARIKYETGARVFKFAMARRADGWHKNGEQCQIDNYSLDAVNAAGIVAGCHRISWEEIERFARQENWMA